MKKITTTHVHKVCRNLLLLTIFIVTAVTQGKANRYYETKLDTPSIEGRWDMILYVSGKPLPSWLEVRHSGVRTLVGDYVGTGGSARPISKINFSGGTISFSLPPQWEKETNDISFEGVMTGDSLSGTMVSAAGKTSNWSAVRAPSLRRQSEPAWGSPIKLFSGSDLKGWHASGENQWKAEGGILRSPKSGSNLITDKTFTDFKLHIEFRYPKESNSGIYLRGRYELQISDSKGMDPVKDQFGAVYGFIAPSEMVAKDAGEWQSYDVTLVGRMITVVANGKTIICNREIPGITGGALNSSEGEPGPFYIQGDHGPVDYRNIIVTPAK